MKFWTFERQITTGVLTLGLALVSAFAVSEKNTEQLVATSQRVSHTQNVLDALDTLLVSLVNLETGVRGYIITGQESYLAPYYTSRSTINENLENLKNLTSDNPSQQNQLLILNKELDNQLKYRNNLIQTAKSSGLERGRNIILDGAGKRSMDKIRNIIGDMRIEENRLLKIRQEASRQSNQNSGLILNVLRIFMMSVLVGAYLVVIREIKMRHKAERDLQSLNNNLEDRVQRRTTSLETATHALRESEARLQTSMETLSEGVAISDMNGRLLHFNRAALALHGFTKLEESHLNLPDFTQLIRLNTLEGIVIPLEQWPLSRVLKGETLRNYEVSITHLRVGWTRIYSYNGSLARDTEKNPVLAVVTITDITEKKQVELRTITQMEHLDLLNQITRLIGERLDLQSIFQLVVRMLEASLPVDFACIAQYDSVAHTLTLAYLGIKNQMLADTLSSAENATISANDNGLGRCTQGELVCEQDISQIPFPFTQLLADNGMHSLVMAPLHVENQVFGILIVTRSAANAFTNTECEFLRQLAEHVALAAWHAQLHAALTQSYEDLRQTQQVFMQEERLRALGQMASGIAHDINNALSPVSLYTESLLDNEKDLSPRARNYLETIYRAVDDVAETVARMREFYRKRETQMELATVNINHLVSQVLELTHPRWQDMPQERGIMIQPQILLQPDLPTIMGVESEIRDALTNLIFNAVDAMPNGGILTVQTRVVCPETPAEGDTMVAIEVTDTGIGMDEATQQRCLEPFFTTKGESGTGMGLAMVFGMVQRHSANLQIESAPGKGTTIRLLFSIGTTVIPDDSTVLHLPENLPKMQVLLIDDDPILLKSLTDTLEMDGHIIVSANGGEQGIAIFNSFIKQGKPLSVVITDLGMPYVDGHKVAAAIKSSSPNTPVILLTGWGKRLIAEGETPKNVDRVLSKPLLGSSNIA